MQIHELTRRQRTDEGLADIAGKVGTGVSKVAGFAGKVGGKIADIKGAYRGAQMDQQVAATADKAYRAWKTYKTQLDNYYAKSGAPAPAGSYEKALLSFVQKNLLGGAYLPNLTNKNEILGLVKKIAGDAVIEPAETEPPAAETPPATDQTQPSGTVTGASKPGAPTPAEQAKFQQKIQQALAKKPVKEALDPAQEKQLFSQLVRAAALSNTEVATGQTSAKPGAPTTTKQVQDPHQLIGNVQAVVEPVVDRAKLAQAGKVLRDKFQLNPVIDSTEDDAVDALLMAMGFQPS